VRLAVSSLIPLVLVLAACDVPQAMRLPSDPSWLGGCSIGVGRHATLHGSPSDPRVTWATDDRSGRRFELVWPVGYQALFDPQLVLLDPTNVAVAREGDQIIGSCFGRGADEMWRVEGREVIHSEGSSSEPPRSGQS
jgi:hypothetical protein